MAYYKEKPLHILIDIHNFLDEEVANKLGCPITHIPTLSVEVADGARVTINSTLNSSLRRSTILIFPRICFLY